MNLPELMKKNRQEELKAVFRFIDKADLMELAQIIDEIRCCHDNILVFNWNTALLAKVESVGINGECLQLNLEEGENENES